MKKIFYLLFFNVAVLALLTACEPEVPVTLSLSTNTVQLKVGDIYTIEAIGTATNIEWTSSDEEVAEVYHGVITAKAIGATVVTARSGKVFAECMVYVTGTDGATLRISPPLVTMKVGETHQFSYGNTYALDLTWSSSDASVASVNETGLVTAHKPGNAVITLASPMESVTALVAVEHVWGEYQLVWSDEFNGTTLDESVWTIQVGGGGWGNQEKQYYTGRQENLRVEDGCLVIEARKEAYENYEYTSARIMSRGKKSFTYGRIEASISLPSGGGLWPAFWMLGNGNWPNCGEIDIMEYVGNVPNRILGTLHTAQDRSGSKSSRQYWGTNIENKFHTYGIEWACEEKEGKDVIRFYVDNDVYSEQIESVIDNKEYWPFNQPQYFIINMAIGGTLGGNIDEAIWTEPRLMKVDWVRVYQRQEK